MPYSCLTSKVRKPEQVVQLDIYVFYIHEVKVAEGHSLSSSTKHHLAACGQRIVSHRQSLMPQLQDTFIGKNEIAAHN